MAFERPEDFYKVYDAHRVYVPAKVRKKHIAEFDRNIWRPLGFSSSDRVLELGCGVGLFLAYLNAKGANDVIGVDMDKKAREYMPPDIASKVQEMTIDAFLGSYDGPQFDRIVLLDVFEHFSHGEGIDLLQRLRPVLRPDGCVVMRMPNCSSPWGWHYQLGDLTHKSQNTPSGMQHIALAAGMDLQGCYPYTRGSKGRRFTNRLIEGLLDRMLTDPPPIWTANFIAVLRLQN